MRWFNSIILTFAFALSVLLLSGCYEKVLVKEHRIEHNHKDHDKHHDKDDDHEDEHDHHRY